MASWEGWNDPESCTRESRAQLTDKVPGTVRGFSYTPSSQHFIELIRMKTVDGTVGCVRLDIDRLQNGSTPFSSGFNTEVSNWFRF